LTDSGPRRWIAEAHGNYTTNMKCTWFIEAQKPNSTIRLHLNEFATECGWDHLYIWDGDNIFSGQQAVYSGLVRHERYSTSRVPEVVGTSGAMLLHFYSDVAYNMTGFNITFSMDSCPSEYSATTCSGHGTCNDDLTCECDSDYKGLACEIPACPRNCDGKGKCDKTEKRCICNAGWRGEDCSQEEQQHVWEVVQTGDLSEDRRTSHGAVLIGDEMWVVGGEQLHKQPPHSMIRRYNFGTGSWGSVELSGPRVPSERYGHSVVTHDNKIYMYGGVMRSGHVSKELWSFDLDSREWDKETVIRGRCLGELCGEIHCAGHTATLVENRMILMFGHSPKYGYMDTVQEYHFGSREWNVIATQGYPVKGGYGHSAVFDKSTKKIFVYGGYISVSGTSSQLSNSLYAFDIHASRWELRKPSYSNRYLHSAVAAGGLMLVYGGNTHNDTQWSQGAKCYSSDFIAYDIACDRWYTLENTIPRDFSGDMSRFGHSALMYKGSMYIYGGFNGQTKSDILLFSPGSCSHVKDPLQCVNSRFGVKCVWNRKKEVCEVYSADIQRSFQETCHNNPNQNVSVGCQQETSCHSCLATRQNCVWCSDGCQPDKCPLRKDIKAISRLGDCLGSGAKEVCENMHTCDGCTALQKCKWNMDKTNNDKICREKSVMTGGNDSDEGGLNRKEIVDTCSVSCSERNSCGNCTSGHCMWCHNLESCIDRNAYLVAFPYGQCMDWTTSRDECFESKDNSTSLPNLCHGYQTCSICLSNPACGWCDEGSETGLGKCHEGGASGPLERVGTKSKRQYSWEPSSVCAAYPGGWHFTSCPECQCNGHSNCTQPGICAQPCQHRTQGRHCERCTDGYYGNPVNGGGCKKCECNGQGTLCDHKTGNCFCNTKGVTGDHCEKCDTQNHYFGDPITGSCFYDLAIDYQFTFNLSKTEDRHYTAINFKNVPTKPDVDVDFSITCSVPSKINLTYRHNNVEGGGRKEETIIQEFNCSIFKFRFSKGDYTFGNEENTTFYVYVYDFQSPLWIIISFSQHPKLDLLQFFITFSVCFLALLFIAAILWKIKQKYDRYRRRQRLYVEMEQMASRPFGSVLVEMERIPESENTLHTARKRRKKTRPSPIALEPCIGNRAAILSLVVRLPTGGASYSPHGVPGIAVASSLVTLGNPRKQSTDQTQKVENEPKTRKRGGKVSANTHTVTDL